MPARGWTRAVRDERRPHPPRIADRLCRPLPPGGPRHGGRRAELCGLPAREAALGAREVHRPGGPAAGVQAGSGGGPGSRPSLAAQRPGRSRSRRRPPDHRGVQAPRRPHRVPGDQGGLAGGGRARGALDPRLDRHVLRNAGRPEPPRDPGCGPRRAGARQGAHRGHQARHGPVSDGARPLPPSRRAALPVQGYRGPASRRPGPEAADLRDPLRVRRHARISQCLRRRRPRPRGRGAARPGPGARGEGGPELCLRGRGDPLEGSRHPQRRVEGIAGERRALLRVVFVRRADRRAEGARPPMIYSINATHDLSTRSWVESANAPGTDFPIQNLPYGVYKVAESSESPRVGVAIGDQVLDLIGVATDGGLNTRAQASVMACRSGSLNRFMAQVPSAWSSVREEISRILRTDAPADVRTLAKKHLTPLSRIGLLLPARIGDYTDFYASIHHATNVGKLVRPDTPLLPNYKYVPIGYHGRSSSIFVSGGRVRRPRGQYKLPGAAEPEFGHTQLLDYELEVGFFTGNGNPLGDPIPLEHAEEHLFGVCLLNDWTARDVQSWEYQPLGPFLSKNFATTISPWIVTLEALQPFRSPAFVRPTGDPGPLPYLESPQQSAHGGFDIRLQAFLSSKMMRDQGTPPLEICASNLRDLYWTPAQLLTHHASNGCNLRPGDLLGTGTVSGASREAMGCLLELTAGGAAPIRLPNSEQRTFLEDGDEVILRGYCEREG